MLLSVISILVDMETADPIVETTGELGEGRSRDAQEGLHLVGGQLEPERKAGARGFSKEVVLEALVREQPAEYPFHIPLAHSVLPIMPQMVGLNVYPGQPAHYRAQR